MKSSPRIDPAKPIVTNSSIQKNTTKLANKEIREILEKWVHNRGIVQIKGEKQTKNPLIKNIPIVKDVETMAELLNTIGSEVKINHKNKESECSYN